MGRPKTGQTPVRHIRLSDKLWGKVGDVADKQGRTKSEVTVDALEQYVGEHLDDGESQ